MRDYVPDLQGSTIAVLDSVHNTTDSWPYWPFGEAKSQQRAELTLPGSRA